MKPVKTIGMNSVRNEPKARRSSVVTWFYAMIAGCFPFNHIGETLYFDISMSDLPSDTSPDAGDYF